ncbi:MAG TPA: phage holin family protein [Paludibacteraceae bacterium]|nr:phage holin family protein [Paludibacteraceae bacterium]
MDLFGAIMEDLQLAQFAIKEAFWFLLCGGLTFGAILVDLSTGVSKARALKEKVYSGGLRKSFIKLRDYLSIFYFGVIVDIALNLVWKYMPIGLVTTCIAASAIELISVVENLKLKKSAAAKMPEIVAKMIEVKDTESAVKLLNELKNLLKKSGNCE